MIVSHAKDLLKTQGGFNPTLFIVDGKKGMLGVISGGDFPNNSDEKRKLFEAIGADYAERMPGAECFFLMTEAWASAARNGSEPVMPPSQDPNRIEIFMISAKRTDGADKFYTQAYKHGKNGKIEFLDRKEIIEMNSKGWIDNRKKGGEDGTKIQNGLLDSLWRSFMLAKILKPNK